MKGHTARSLRDVLPLQRYKNFSGTKIFTRHGSNSNTNICTFTTSTKRPCINNIRFLYLGFVIYAYANKLINKIQEPCSSPSLRLCFLLTPGIRIRKADKQNDSLFTYFLYAFKLKRFLSRFFFKALTQTERPTTSVVLKKSEKAAESNYKLITFFTMCRLFFFPQMLNYRVLRRWSCRT